MIDDDRQRIDKVSEQRLDVTATVGRCCVMILAVAMLSASGCSSSSSADATCTLTKPDGGTIEISIDTQYAKVRDDADGELSDLAAIPADAAPRGAIATSSSAGEPLLVVVGPSAMTDVVIDDDPPSGVQRCDGSDLSVGLVPARLGTTARVSGTDQDDRELFVLDTPIEEAGGVLVQIGSEPASDSQP